MKNEGKFLGFKSIKWQLAIRSQGEVAKLMGMTQQAVAYYERRALTKIRNRMGKFLEESRP